MKSKHSDRIIYLTWKCDELYELLIIKMSLVICEVYLLSRYFV